MPDPTRFGLVGPSYQSQNLSADNQACVNFYLEQDESGAGNAPVVLMPTPGTKLFVELLAGRDPSTGLQDFDVAFDAQSSGVSTPAVVSGTPNHANEAAIVFVGSDTGGFAGNGPDPGAGWTALDFASDGTFGSIYARYQAGATPLTASEPLNAAGNWGAILGFFGSKTAAVPTVIQVMTLVSGSAPAGTYTSTFPNPVVAGNAIFIVDTAHILRANLVTMVGSDNQANIYGSLGITGASVANVGGGVGAVMASEVKAGPTTVSATVTYDAALSNSSTIKAYEIAGLGPVSSPVRQTRGSISITGRTFFVAGTGFFEILANATFTLWGSVANDSLPVTMAATPQQLLLASAGVAYVFNLTTNTLIAIPGVTFSGPVSQCGVCDDFFIVTIKDSKEFVVSAPLDANDWVTNGSAIVSVFPDNIVGMIVSHRQIVFGSDTKTVFYYDSGNIFPFDVIPGSDMDQGLAAENSYSLLNNTFLWLGSDERGHGKVWTASGYTPTRVSNHAIEFAIQGYQRIDDAVSFTYQDQGHDFYCLYFPTPSVMWVLDTITGMWHQQTFTIAINGLDQAAHRWNHTFNFGRHLVGDWQSGKVYEMHIPLQTGTVWTFGDNDGSPIVRRRRAPHISKSQRRQFFNELQLFVQAGLGPVPPLLDPSGNPRGPMVSMRFSNDSGRTWSNWLDRDCGMAGEYQKRLRWLRLGEGRDRIFEIQYSDPPALRIVDAYLDYEEGAN